MTHVPETFHAVALAAELVEAAIDEGWPIEQLLLEIKDIWDEKVIDESRRLDDGEDDHEL